MNMAQWLLSIGMEPQPLDRDGLSAPALNTDGATTTEWDKELGGAVVVPVKTTKAREKPPCQ